jgi:DNA repair protein RecO (recombination protein O)
VLHKTKGIVLNFIRYRESSIIVKIYTEIFGLRTYMVNGVRNTKTAKIALYQPLNQVEMVVYENEKADIQRIAEIRLLQPYQTLTIQPSKISIAFFLTEVLSKCLKEETSNVELFAFLSQSLYALDKLKQNFANFHLQMLIKLCEYLGFALHQVTDLQSQLQANGYKFYHIGYNEVIQQLIISNYGDPVLLNGNARTDIATYLCLYYRLHVESFGELHSLKILKEL